MMFFGGKQSAGLFLKYPTSFAIKGNSETELLEHVWKSY